LQLKVADIRHIKKESLLFSHTTQKGNVMKPTQEAIEEQEVSLPTDHDFTSSCKQQIIDYAKKSYAEQGRGAVVVELCNTVLVEGGLFVPLSYYNESNALFEKLEGWPDQEMEQMVGSYNPRREAVCAIVEKPKSLAYALIKGR
jgi:hypothetical protein